MQRFQTELRLSFVILLYKTIKQRNHAKIIFSTTLE